MHIFFSGIGGTAIGPLALIAMQAGYEVSGSDKQDSQYIRYLRKKGLDNIYIGQTREALAKVHERHPIDWYVYSSALEKENPDHPELQFVAETNIKHSKRDLLLNYIIKDKQYKLLAIAGTHGKTTTTAMVIWLLEQAGIPASYSVGAKIPFGDMGHYEPRSEYFVLEADEFDRNFLSFSPYLALISGIAYDHHEIYPTEEIYRQAFREFLGKSAWKFLWHDDFDRLGMETDASFKVLGTTDPVFDKLSLDGRVNRMNAWLAIQAVSHISKRPPEVLLPFMNRFPGVSRRMEPIAKRLYSDYAHTPEKIAGAIEIAREIAQAAGKQLVVVYEPLTNRRMHHTRDQHHTLFDNVDHLYWVPSYLAREDPALPVLNPTQLIGALSPVSQAKAEPMELDKNLQKAIRRWRRKAIVVCLSGGGGNSLDEWLRKQSWGLF